VPHTWWGPFAVWQGGLGIWGGITFGVLAGAFVVRRAGANVAVMMDCVAPALLVAQGIGRWGNYWNQELYGKPTSLPWGLEIDRDHRPDGYPLATTFHPIFLYEFITDLAGAGLLILVGRRFRIRSPALFALYVAYYTFWRMFEELLRVDPSHHFLGERINFWVALVVFLAAVASFVWLQFFRPAGQEPTTGARRPGPQASMTVPRGRVRPRR
jgi:prolipoprotein diacylglyceryl transferase